MDRKGLELPFGAIITGFFLLAIAILFYLVFIARILDLHVIVKSHEAEIHAINLAQVLLSSNLAYSDGYTLHRGIFDKSKLDGGELDKLDIWYPDAVAVVEIEDLDDPGKKWTGILASRMIGSTALTDLIDCLINTFNFDLTKIFSITGPWEWPDIGKCIQGLGNQLSSSTREYPVAIRVSDNEIHNGKMLINLVELIF